MPDGDRASSELLGFLLVFAAVVLTVSLVVVAGAATLEDARQFQRTSNAEAAFLAVSDDVDDVVRAGAPGRSTTVRLDGAALRTTTAETTVTFTNDSGVTTTRTVEPDPVVYDAGSGTTLTYRGGALVRRDGASSVMFDPPEFLLSSEVVVLPLVETRLAGGGVGGTTEVEVRTRHAGTELLAVNESVDDVTLSVTGPNAEAWARYFEEADAPVTSVSRTGDTVEVTVETDRLYVTVHRVDVRFV